LFAAREGKVRLSCFQNNVSRTVLNNTAWINFLEMTGNKCIRSSNFHDNVLFNRYYLFRLHRAKFQVLIRTRKEFKDLFRKKRHYLLFFFQCITFYSLICLSHRDLDVLLTFSLFFRSNFACDVNLTNNKCYVLFWN
jgi:hypothetical protein